MGRAERTRVFSRFAAEKEIHTNRRYETNTTDYPADAFRRRGIRPKGRRHSHGRRRRHRGERRRSGADAHACENPGEETVFHLGLQGRGVYSVARLRRIFAFGGFPGLQQPRHDLPGLGFEGQPRTAETQAGRADRNGRQGGQGAAHLAEGRHGELQCRSVQGRGRRRCRRAAEEDARHHRHRRHGRGAGRDGQEGLRRRQGVLRRGCHHGHQVASGRGRRPRGGLQQTLRRGRIFGHGRRRGLQGAQYRHPSGHAAGPVRQALRRIRLRRRHRDRRQVQIHRRRQCQRVQRRQPYFIHWPVQQRQPAEFLVRGHSGRLGRRWRTSRRHGQLHGAPAERRGVGQRHRRQLLRYVGQAQSGDVPGQLFLQQHQYREPFDGGEMVRGSDDPRYAVDQRLFRHEGLQPPVQRPSGVEDLREPEPDDPPALQLPVQRSPEHDAGLAVRPERLQPYREFQRRPASRL